MAEERKLHEKKTVGLRKVIEERKTNELRHIMKESVSKAIFYSILIYL